MHADEARENRRAPAAGPPGDIALASYPETRIGAFDFYAATSTEPLWCGSADAQRACGDSWPGVTEDLFLFSQEDPIGRAGDTSLFGYVGASPASYRDPLGLFRTGDVVARSTTDGRGLDYVVVLRDDNPDAARNETLNGNVWIASFGTDPAGQNTCGYVYMGPALKPGPEGDPYQSIGKIGLYSQVLGVVDRIDASEEELRERARSWKRCYGVDQCFNFAQSLFGGFSGWWGSSGYRSGIPKAWRIK